jgi:tetratricopeptide (TPR) repeat protein
VKAGGHIFISYANRDDAGWASQLAENLEADGFTVFLDRWDIALGENIVHRLNHALETATAGLVVFGRATEESWWVRQEIAALLGLEREGQIILIPVLRGDVPLPRLLASKLNADFRACQSESEYRSCLRQLEDRLRGIRPERTAAGSLGGDSASTFADDLNRRPEGPRRITLTIGIDQVSVRSWYGEAVIPYDGLDPKIRERHWVAEREQRRAATGGRRDPDGAADLQTAYLKLGQALGNQVLAGSIGELIEKGLADADRQNAALQIALEIAKDSGLQSLPWEALCLPGHDEPLILHSRVQMYHFVPGLGSTPTMAIPGPLKILAVIASPESRGGELLNYEAELDRLLEAVDPARREERAQVRVLAWGSAAAIRAALNEDRYHILHICCQARDDQLILETEDGQPDPVDAERFASDVLVADQGVPLIVLSGSTTPPEPDPGSAAEPGPDSSVTTLPGLARGLLAHGVPAVVAMGADGDGQAAIRLASSFYRSLASRRAAPDALAALSDARRDLGHRLVAASPDDHGPDLTSWWRPSLYLRTEPGPLFDQGAVTTASGPATVSRPRGGRFGPEAEDFVGRRGDLRTLLRTLRGRQPTAFIYGIGGMGKTSLANRLVEAMRDETDVVLFRRGRTSPTEIFRELGGKLQTVYLTRRLAEDDPLARVADKLRNPQQDWVDQLPLVEDLVLPHVSVLIVLDEAEQNTGEPELNEVSGGAPGQLDDPEMAAFIQRWSGLSPSARLLVTSRYPIALPRDVLTRMTSHHLGPLSRAETRKLMWRLPGLDALGPDDRNRAYADVGGHPRALEYLDSLLRGRTARFRDVAARMEEALLARGITDPSAWVAQGPRGLDQALAETVTLVVDDVLVDRLLTRLQSFPLALRLFVGSSVLRTPVDAIGLNWAVAESLEPAADPAREARLAQAYEQLTMAQQSLSALVLEELTLRPAELNQILRDIATRGRPEERAGLTRAIEALVEMSLLAEVQVPPPGDPRYLVHRWTARGLRYLVANGLTGLVEAEDLTAAHQRAAAYYEWRADIWPDAIADLLEARYHRQEAGELQAAANIAVRTAAILFRRGAFSLLRRLAEESRPAAGSSNGSTGCELLYWQSRAAQAQGEITSAQQLADDALDLAKQLGDMRWMASCHERRAAIAERSDYATAESEYRTALDLAHELGNAVIEARCYQGRGAVAMAQSDDGEAQRWSRGALNYCSPVRILVQEMIVKGLRQLRDLARARGDLRDAERLTLECSERLAEYHDLQQIAGRSQLQIGEISLRRNDLEGARTAFEAAQEIAGRSGDRVMEKDCHLQLGRTWQRQGMLARARQSYQRYINMADDMGDRPGTVDCYQQMGELDSAAGDHRGAMAWHERALELAEQLGQRQLQAEAHCQLGKNQLALGELDQAQDAFRRCQRIGEEAADPQIIVSSKLGLAEVELAAGQLATAEQIYRECRAMARRSHDQASMVKGLMGLATIARRRRDYDDAAHLFDQARQNAAAIGNRAAELDCLMELGINAHDDPGRTDAVEYLELALELAENLQDSLKTAELCVRLGNLAAPFSTRMDWYERAVHTYESAGLPMTAANLWLRIGRVAADHDLEEATRCCHRALALTGDSAVSALTVEIQLELARYAREAGDHRTAWQIWRGAARQVSVLQQDDLTAVACQEGGLISQLTGAPNRARELHQEAQRLAGRVGDAATVLASCRDLGRLARWQGGQDQESAEGWYRQALTLAKQARDQEAITACAQQLMLAATRAGDDEQVSSLLAENSLLIGWMGPGLQLALDVAADRGRLGSAITRGGRPDEALGFTAASMLAWLETDRQRTDEQREWLRRQRTELGGERFAELLGEYLDESLVAAVLDVLALETDSNGGAEASAAASAEVDAEGGCRQQGHDDQ